MTRFLVAAVTVAAALLFAAPAGAVDPLTLTKSSPADRASVPVTPTGGIPWQITTAGVPDDAQVAVTVSSTGATGGDGVTLATADRVDFFFLSATGAPGGWAARSDPGPNAWSADAGTYFWQAVATWTDAGGVFHSAASPIARLFLGVSPPAAATNPGAASGSSRATLRMSALDAAYYVRTVIRRHTKRAPVRLRTACARLSSPTFRCRPTWRDSRNSYRTTATFTHVRSGGRVVARATVTGRRASRRCVRQRSFASCARRFRWRSTLAARPLGKR
jgi:hypothetical protein